MGRVTAVNKKLKDEILSVVHQMLFRIKFHGIEVLNFQDVILK